jgi:hypothetical protein
MKKYSIVFSFIMMIAIAAPAGAYSVNFASDYYWDSVKGEYTGYTSPYAGAIVETFDPNANSNLGWTLTGNYEIRLGSITPAAAPWWDNNPNDGGAPAGARDASYFLTVPKEPLSNGISVTIGFKGAAYNYFGLWWGSMDTYNTLEFLGAAGNVVATVDGTDFSDGSGAQDLSETNKYVNFYGMGDFYGVRLISTNYAFEVDNLAVGYNVVPEPLTAILLGCGLLGLFGLRRKLS